MIYLVLDLKKIARHYLEVRPVADIPIVPGLSVPAPDSRDIMETLIRCSNLDNFPVFNLCLASKGLLDLFYDKLR